MWKTKEITRPNGTKKRLMICQNSKPSESKWADFAPEGGVCENWSEVAHNTTASLCHECTGRSVGGMKV
jgi:hypothetical protein